MPTRSSPNIWLAMICTKTSNCCQKLPKIRSKIREVNRQTQWNKLNLIRAVSPMSAVYVRFWMFIRCKIVRPQQITTLTKRAVHCTSPRLSPRTKFQTRPSKETIQTNHSKKSLKIRLCMPVSSKGNSTRLKTGGLKEVIVSNRWKNWNSHKWIRLAQSFSSQLWILEVPLGVRDIVTAVKWIKENMFLFQRWPMPTSKSTKYIGLSSTTETNSTNITYLNKTKVILSQFATTNFSTAKILIRVVKIISRGNSIILRKTVSRSCATASKRTRISRPSWVALLHRIRPVRTRVSTLLAASM